MNQPPNISPNDLLDRWIENQPRGNWDWDTFKAMLREAKRFGAFPTKLPEIITLSNAFKSLAKTIQNMNPINLEFGSILYTNMNDGRLVSGRIQKGSGIEITLIGEVTARNLIISGTIHRHPENGIFPEIIQKRLDKLDFILGLGSMFFSQCNFDGKGDILSLLSNQDEIFSAVVYKTWVGFAVKTNRAPNVSFVQQNYASMQQDIMRIASTTNPKDGFKEIGGKYGIEFYYTTDFKTEPLVKVFD